MLSNYYVDTMQRFHDKMAKKGHDWGDSLTDAFDDLFGDFARRPFVVTRAWDMRSVNVTSRREETESELVVSFDLPGVKPGDVSVSVDGEALSIAYKLREKEFKLKCTVSSDYDPTVCSAKLEHGVLELRFPRVTKAQGKKIDIEVK